MKKILLAVMAILCFYVSNAQSTNTTTTQVPVSNLLPPGGNCTIGGTTAVTSGQSYTYSLPCLYSSGVTWQASNGTVTSHSNTSATVVWGALLTLQALNNNEAQAAQNIARSGPSAPSALLTWGGYIPATTMTGSLEAISGGAVVASLNVTITIPALTGGTISPAQQTIAYNAIPSSLTYSGASGGNGSSYSYQWQVSQDGYTWSNISGATGTGYSPGALQNNTYYQVAVSQSGQSTVYSNTASALVTLQAGTISPASKTISYNTTPGALICSAPKGGGITHTYQWQESTDNANWSNIAGANTLTYTPGDLIATTYYRLQTDGQNSNTSTITVTGGVSSPVIASGSSGTTIDLTKPIGTPKGNASTGGNGEAAYSIPLDVLPGTNGMAPSISLGYNSGRSGGIAGWGWQLSALSSISRTGKNIYYNGVTAPVSYTNTNDAFVLDGQRLFPTSGNNGADQTTYGQENEDFSKVESFGGTETSGPSYFTVTTKDGSILEYGNATDSKVMTNDGQSTMLWLLDKVTDKNGNYISYVYNVDDAKRSYILTEIDYTGNSAAGLSPYNKILFHYAIRSDWQTTRVYDGGASISYPYLLNEIDLVNSSGTTEKSYKCTYGILHGEYFLKTFTEGGSDGTAMNPLKFVYGSDTTTQQQYISPTFPGLANGSTIYSGNFRGEGKYGLIDAYYSTTNNNLNNYTGYDMFGDFGEYGGQPAADIDGNCSDRFSTAYNTVGASNFEGLNGLLTNDYDGDGKSDVLFGNFSVSGTTVSLNKIQINFTKRVFALAPVYVKDSVVYSTLPTASGYTGNFKYIAGNYIIPGDFDGDGSQDYILVLGLNSNSDFKAFFNSPKKGIVNKEVTGFGVGGSSTDPFYATTIAGADAVIPVDFDGDGKTDLLVETPSESYIISVNVTTDGNLSAYSASQLYATSSIVSGNVVYPGDFNGDGKTDLLVRSNATGGQDASYGAWNILYSTGKDFNSYPFVWSYRPLLDGDDYSTTNPIMVADLNGDGKSDVWQSLDFYDSQDNLHSLHTIYYSFGEPIPGSNSLTAFNRQTDTAAQSINLDNGIEPVYGDFNGDGNMDIVTMQSTNAVFIYAEPFKEDHKMVNAINGLGGESDFYYDLLNNDDIYSMSNNYYYDTLGKPPGQGVNGNPYNVVNGSMYVVRQLSVPNGLGGSVSTQYNYADAAVYPMRGFLGFKQITSANASTGIQTTNIMDIDNKFFVPKPVRQFSIAESGDTLKNTYITDTLPAASTNVGDKRFIQQVRKETDINGLTGSAIETDNTYDSYGNVTTKVIKTGSASGTTVSPTETKTITTAYAAYGTPVPAYPTSVAINNSRTGQSAVTKSETYTYDTKGNPTVKVDFSGTSDAVTSTYTYDNFGNATKLVLSATGLTSRTAQNTMDAQGRFVLKQQRVGSSVTKTENLTYDDWGDTLTHKTAEGLLYTTQYNGFFRPIKKTVPGSYSATITYAWESATPARYSIATSQPGGGANQKIFFDMLGRPIEKQTSGFNNQTMTQSFTYNYAGQLASSTKPYYASESPVTVSYTYDNDNRLIKVSTPVNYVSYAYAKQSGGQYKTTTTTSAGQSSSKTQDAAGRTISASDNGGTLNYTYDSRGNQLKVTMGSNTLTTSTYDVYGRQASLTDINSGAYTYQYDAFGQLTQQKDPLSHTYTLSYDEFGRLVSRIGPEGTTSYTYYSNTSTGYSSDNLTKVTGFSGDETDYTYDSLQRVQTKKVTVDGTAYTTTYAYDTYSNPVKITYPDGIIINRTFDPNRIVTGTSMQNGSITKTLFTATAMNSAGVYTGYTYGNGKTGQVTFDLTLDVPTRYYTAGIQDLNNVFDANTGNLTSRKDAIKNLTETFTYDNLNRLTGSKVNNVQQLSQQYDSNNGISMGNIIQKSDAGKYVYSTSKINAVAYITDTGSNQTLPPPNLSQNMQQIGYTPFMMTDSVAQNGYAVHFTYAGDYNRIKSVTAQNGTTTETRYYFGDFEKQIKGSTTRYVHYVYAGNGLCAIVVSQGSTVTPYFVYSDHLGSILTVTDSTGAIAAQQNFDAWGRNRNPANWTYTSVPTVPDWLYRGYSGHEHLPQFALINMNGRIYDPVQGRMLSPDIFVQFPYRSQSYNRYSYVTNNPLLFTDPSGYVAEAKPGDDLPDASSPVIVTGSYPSDDGDDFDSWYLLDDYNSGYSDYGGGPGGGGSGSSNPSRQFTILKNKIIEQLKKEGWNHHEKDFGSRFNIYRDQDGHLYEGTQLPNGEMSEMTPIGFDLDGQSVVENEEWIGEYYGEQEGIGNNLIDGTEDLIEGVGDVIDILFFSPIIFNPIDKPAPNIHA